MNRLLLILTFVLVQQISLASLPILKVNDTAAVADNPMFGVPDNPVKVAGEPAQHLTTKKSKILRWLRIKPGKNATNYPEENAKPDFSWWGFALGLLYGPIGFLVAVIASEKSSVKKSAWLGFRIWMVAVGVILLVLLTKAGK